MLDRLFLATAALVVLSLLAGAMPASAAGDVELGRRLYREGLLASGQPAQARLSNGLTMRGEAAACSNCHRRSGYGASEGYTIVRPITGPYLFSPDDTLLKKVFGRSARPETLPQPYDEAGLKRSLREGIDIRGQVLGDAMPRYPLDDADADNLIAYLRTLSAEPSPGVDDSRLHFATVVDEAADPAKSAAMLEIMTAFLRDKNAGTRLEGKRSAKAPWDMARIYKAYRTWELHVWRLSGPQETWPAQLEAYYRAQPVFAVVGGIGAGSWQPVHDFCQKTELPCLFPHLASPPPGREDFYSLYLSRGAGLEAGAIANQLDKAAGKRVLQVYRQGDATAEAAAHKLADTLAPAGTLASHVVPAGQALDAGYWQAVLAKAGPDTLVLWLDKPDLAALAALARDRLPAEIYLSASLTGYPYGAGALPEGSLMAYPFDLPERLDRRLNRMRVWLRSKGIAVHDEAVQADTFFALGQAGEAAMHMIDNYSRDYFIELIEHALENSLMPSMYPAPALGPDQRYASKGAYIVRLDPAAPGGLKPVSDWIVP